METRLRHQLHPEKLLDHTIGFLELKNDAGLARALEWGTSSLSKIRHGRAIISADLLLRMHVTTGIPIKSLRHIAGDFRAHTGASASIQS